MNTAGTTRRACSRRPLIACGLGILLGGAGAWLVFSMKYSAVLDTGTLLPQNLPRFAAGVLLVLLGLLLLASGLWRFRKACNADRDPEPGNGEAG